MARPTHRLFIDPANNRLLTGVNANGSGDRLRFFAGDTARVELHLVRLTGDSAFPAEAVSFADWLDAAASVSLAVGPLETEPTSGTYRVEFDGDLSDPIAASASASAVEAALNDIPSVASLGGVAVTKVGEFYRVEFDSNPPAEFTFDASALVPRSTVVTSTPTVGGAARLFRIRQVPVALATTWAAVPSASASLSVVSGWNGTSSTVRLTIAEARGGSFNLNFKSVAGINYPFNLIPSDSSGTSLAGFLNPEASTLGGTVSVRQIGVGVFDISTPVQPFAVGSDGWTVDGSGLDSFVGLVGDLDFNTVEAETLLDGADSVEVTVEVEAVGGGRYFTAYQERADLAADLVDNGPLGPVLLDTPLGTAEAASLYVTQAFAAANYLTALTGAGLFLSKSLNLSDIPSPSTARANLGLGTMATETASNFLSKAGNLSGLGDASASRSNLGLGSIATASATDYLAKADNLSGIASPSTARTNLGLGTMATETATNYLAKADNLSGLASTSTSRTNLGLGTIATINDAPSNGSTYGRLNGAWSAISAGGAANVQTFGAAGSSGTFTWTKPANAKFVHIFLWSGGGGGGAGAMFSTGTNRCGGGGGAGGTFTYIMVPAAHLNATESVVIGAGGAGGSGQVAGTGNNGSVGGDTTFKLWKAVGGNFGTGGSSASGTGGTARQSYVFVGNTTAGGAGNGAAGGGGSGTSQISIHWLPTGGGAGGGQAASVTLANPGGAGGLMATALNNSGLNVTISGGAGGTIGFVSPVAGTTTANSLVAGTGGGGGFYRTGVVGNAGAAGGFPGGGGGGGAAADSPNAPGSGGAGGTGYAYIVTIT